MSLALDGTTHEIDLTNKNAASLRNDFAAWTDHARTVAESKTTGRSSRGSTTTARRPNTDREHSARIRE